MVKPIRPEEMLGAKKEFIPDEIIEIFNELIIEKWNGSSAVFKQEDVVKLVKERLAIEGHLIFDRHYLDVEDIFREVGWIVKYDKPAYNETYPATFEFTRK